MDHSCHARNAATLAAGSGALLRFAEDQSGLLLGVTKASLVKENLGFFEEEF